MRNCRAETVAGLYVWAGLAVTAGLFWLTSVPSEAMLRDPVSVALAAAVGGFSAAAAGRSSRRPRAEVGGLWTAALALCTLLILGVADTVWHPQSTWGTGGPDVLIWWLTLASLTVFLAGAAGTVACARYVTRARREESA